jgi:hypothetical protein
MISLSDVPPYIGSAKYEITIAGGRLMAWVEDHADEGGFDIDPDFQRGHVWTDALRTAFVEHLLRGGEHGRTIVWNSPNYNARMRGEETDLPPTLVLVDGKQRFTAITRFLADEVEVFGGHRFSDFDDASKRDMRSMTGALRMAMSVHALQYRRELLELYLQMNAGAVAHDPAELDRVRAMRDAATPPGDAE